MIVMKDRIVFFVYVTLKGAYNFPSLNIFDSNLNWLIKLELPFFPFSIDNTLHFRFLSW